MDAVSGFAGTRLPRSGGKIVRPRRTAAVRTPYDRPAPRSQDPPPPQQNPSWISRLVFKPARVIASNAGKFISSVVFSESSEDEDSASDIDGDEDVEKDITDFTEDEKMDFVHPQQPTIQRLSTERVIEQLLMQETFAREEGDRLIEIIKARVVDHPSVPAAYEGRHSDNRLTNDVNVGEMSNQAVMEARKWLEEKKSASSSKYKTTEDGAGSPVDVAKSYMRARLPWGSPAVNNSEFRTPSPSPYPYSAGNLSSSKLERRSRCNQSWNIQDEIRKVRAKATEEMLKSEPSSNVASLESKQSPCNLDASLNVDGGVQAVVNEQNRALPNSVIPTYENNQTTEGNQAAEEIGVLHTRFCGVGLDETFISTQGVKLSGDTNTSLQSGIGVEDFDNHDHNLNQPSSFIGVTPNAVLALEANLDPTGNFCIPKDVFETRKENDEIGAERHTPNGFSSPSPSPSVAMEGQPKPKPPEVPKASQPDDDITVGNGSDGAMNDENNDSDSSSSRNSSHEEEWLPGDQSLRNSNSTSSSLGTTKLLAYSRRGRGRGRGRGRRI